MYPWQIWQEIEVVPILANIFNALNVLYWRHGLLLWMSLQEPEEYVQG